jgi:hypothetical protein
MKARNKENINYFIERKDLYASVLAIGKAHYSQLTKLTPCS